MSGEWVGESSEEALEDRVRQTWSADPEVLVTHAPAWGRVDVNSAGESEGSVALARALENPGRIRAHFHGHTHFSGGETLQAGGVLSVNGAKGVRVVEL